MATEPALVANGIRTTYDWCDFFYIKKEIHELRNVKGYLIIY